MSDKNNPEITISSESALDIFNLVNFKEIVINSVANIFKDMINLPVESMDGAAEIEAPIISSAIDFLGTVTGQVHLYVPHDFAKTIAASITGMEPADLDDEIVMDTIGEVTNMVSGNLKSDLCNVGLECKLHVPKITRVDCIAKTHQEVGGILTFKSGEHSLNVVMSLSNKAAK